MARLENLELPATSSFPADQAQLLNDRFLLIAERLKSASSASGAVTIATHVERNAQFPAAQQTAGAQFWESDRTSVYVVRTIKKAQVWQFEAGMYADVFTNRPGDLGLYDAGFLFYATDRNVTWRWTGSGWSYLWGTYKRTQAQLAALAATLGTGDANLRVEVTDYNHILRWSGTAWTRAPEDSEHSDSFHFFGAAPTDTGWHACDGTAAVNFLKYDGSLGTRNMPNVTGGGPCYMKLASTYSESITAAAAPTFTGTAGNTSSDSAGTPAGTNSTPTFTGNSLPTHFHDAPIHADGGGTAFVLGFASENSYTASTKLTGAPDGTSGLSALETTAVSAGVPSGTITTPIFTGAALGGHSHTFTPAGTISLAGGDPIAHFQAIPYYRQ